MVTTVPGVGPRAAPDVVQHLHPAEVTGCGRVREHDRWLGGGARGGPRRRRAGAPSSPTTAHGPSPATPRRSRSSTLPWATSAATRLVDRDGGEVAQRLGRATAASRASSASSGTRLVDGEGADGGAAQVAQVGAAAERGADVGGQRADVGARRARRPRSGSSPARPASPHLEAVDGDRAGLALDLDALAGQLVQALAVDLDRRHHRRHLQDVAGEARRPRPAPSSSVDAAHVPGAGDLAGRVERGGLGAEHDHAGVGLGREAEVAQQPGDLADAEEQHAGGVGVERAGVADLAGAEHAAGLGHHVVARPAGRLVDDRQPVRAGRPSLRHQSSLWISRRTSSRRAAPRPTASGLKTQLGRALHAGLAADGALQGVAVLAERLEHLLVVVLAAEGVVVHGGVAEVALAVDRHDRDQLEAVVVDPSRAPRRGSRGTAR